MIHLPAPEKGVAHVTFQVSLEGESYGLEYRWNGRDGRWYLGMTDADGGTVAPLRAIAVGHDWLEGVPAETKPPGSIVPVVNQDYLDGQGYVLDDPGYEDLASGAVRLLYATAAEVEAARAGA